MSLLSSPQSVSSLLLKAVRDTKPLGEGLICHVVPLGKEGTPFQDFLIRYNKSYKSHLEDMLEATDVPNRTDQTHISLPEFLFVGDNVSQSLMQIVLPGQDDDRPILEIVKKQQGRPLNKYLYEDSVIGGSLNTEAVFQKRIELMQALVGPQSASLKRALWQSVFIANERHSQSVPDFNDGTFIIGDDFSISMVDVVGQESVDRPGLIDRTGKNLQSKQAELERFSTVNPLTIARNAVGRVDKIWKKAAMSVATVAIVPAAMIVAAVERKRLRAEIAEMSASYDPAQEMKRAKLQKLMMYLNNGASCGVVDALMTHIAPPVSSSLPKEQADAYISACEKFNEAIKTTLSEIFDCVSSEMKDNSTLALDITNRYPSWLGFQKGIFGKDGEISLVKSNSFQPNQTAVAIPLVRLHDDAEQLLAKLLKIESLVIKPHSAPHRLDAAHTAPLHGNAATFDNC